MSDNPHVDREGACSWPPCSGACAPRNINTSLVAEREGKIGGFIMDFVGYFAGYRNA